MIRAAMKLSRQSQTLFKISIVAIQTELGTDPAGSVTDVKTRLAQLMDGAGNLQFKAANIKTISGGVLTIDQNITRVETEGGAATDFIDTITATSEAFFWMLLPNNSGRLPTIRHAVDNVQCVGGVNIAMGSTADFVIGWYDDVLDVNHAMGFSAGALLAGVNTFSGENKFTAAVDFADAAVSGDTTLDATHGVVRVDATAGAAVITLPTAVGCLGREYSIIKIDSSANTVTIDGDGAETINGATTKVISAQWGGATVHSDNAGWVVKL